MLYGELELSGLELARIVMEINTALRGYYVSSIGAVDESTWLFRLHHSVSPEKRLVISLKRGLWLTTYDLPAEAKDRFEARLRRLLLRGRFLEAEQPDVERLVKIRFICKGSVEKKLIAEFFGGGNLIVTDGEERILALFKRIEVRHRKLAQGLTYTPPPPRGRSPFDAGLDPLEGFSKSGLDIARYLGRELALSRKYVEEVLHRAGIDPRSKSLTGRQEAKLYEELSSLKDLVLGSGAKPTILLEGGRPVDASPFTLTQYTGGECRNTQNFTEAVDLVQSISLLEDLKQKKEEPYTRRIEELNRALEAQAKARLELDAQAKMLRGAAQRLKNQGPLGELPSILTSLGLEYTEIGGELILKGLGRPIKVLKDASPIKAASILFDEAKAVEAKIRAIEKAEEELSEKKKIILTETSRVEEKPPAKIRVVREV